MKPRLVFAALVAAMAVAAAGCIGLELAVTFSPNPIVIRPGDTTIEGTLTIKLTGLGTIRIDHIVVEALDAGGNVVVLNGTQEPIRQVLELGVTVPAFGVERSETVSVDLGYDQIRDLGVRSVRISVLGSKSATLVINVDVAEEPAQ